MDPGSFPCLGPVWTFLYNILVPMLVPIPFSCRVNKLWQSWIHSKLSYLASLQFYDVVELCFTVLHQVILDSVHELTNLQVRHQFLWLPDHRSNTCQNVSHEYVGVAPSALSRYLRFSWLLWGCSQRPLMLLTFLMTTVGLLSTPSHVTYISHDYGGVAFSALSCYSRFSWL